MRLRLRKVLATLAAATAVVVTGASGVLYYQGGRAPAGNPAYVALGSSYAAGAGLGPLQPGSPFACARSIGGYPPRLARLLGMTLVDMSCGGAITDHLLHGGQVFQGPQIRAITPATRLVTITVGGNDIAYAGDLSMLAARHTGTLFGRAVRLFWNGPRTDAQRDFPALERRLLALLSAIHARAPGALLVVATYPTVLPVQGTCRQVGLSDAEAAAMRAVGDRLAAITGAAAARGGALLVDMNALGRGHNACAAEPWISGWANAGVAPFHPTARGAEATAHAIASALAHHTE
ncbi:MAG: SGNH/GDSL hydrolase family protein [Sphingomonadales bacterium]|nr:SGNH/GDSL hydrolase family protein [Sphingomonadales bacterium]